MKSKLTIETEGRSVTTEVIHDELTVSEVVEMLFRPAMLGLGYQDESLEKVIGKIDYDAIIRTEE